MKVGFISLGCSKNLIDTEMCISLFKRNGFEIVNNPNEADVLVVNTCGFIESAKEEAINTLIEMSQYKQNGNCKFLIAMGCLVKRYKSELEKSMPEVDLFISIDDYSVIWDKICELLGIEKKSNYCDLDYHDRTITTGEKSAYLKIAEGCNNNCTYCAIPMIRGKYVSREMNDILKEAEELASNGIQEIIVIAQDTTKYGIDLYGEQKLPELLRKLARINGVKWIRVLYSYPESITDELIDVVKNEEKVLKYFDIPIQHFSDTVLKRMNRKSNGRQIEMLINKIRKEIPGVIIRTSIIVGFPGESEQDFFSLYNFINRAKFERLGCFEYSKEDGTPAARMVNHVHHMTKKSRYNRLMKVQQGIAMRCLRDKIGNQYEVLVEDISPKGKFFIGRSYMESPDTDGVILIKRKKEIDLINKFVYVKIVGISGYDLIAEIVEE